MALALLAGGASRRLGRDKAAAEFVGGSLAQWMLARLAPGFRHVLVASRDPGRFAHLGVPVVADARPERASLVGVYSALLASPVERVLCLACDMPFVTPRLLRCLAEASRGFDVLVPRHSGLLEPLCAVYHRSLTPIIAARLDAGDLRIDHFFPEVRVGYWDIAESGSIFGEPAKLFSNMNTPLEWERARLTVLADPRLASGTAVPASAPTKPETRDRLDMFLQRSPVPVVSFVGKKKSGKTSVASRVVEELCGRGYRVAALKHHSHELEVDTPETDSYRMRQAGAVVAGLCGRSEYFLVARPPCSPDLEDYVLRIPEEVDVVITEGFKTQPAPKIEVSRRARSSRLVSDRQELLAIVSDQLFPTYAVPQFALDDITDIADLVERDVIRGCEVAVAVQEAAGSDGQKT